MMETGHAVSSFGGRPALAAAMALAVVWLLGLGPVFAQQASATRSFDQSTVAPGGTLVVNIAVADYGIAGAVTETLPEGFTYVSSTLDAAQVAELAGNQVRFTLQGDGSLTYTVTAPMAEGSYRFEGTLRDGERADHPVGGASEVTVSVTAPGPTAGPTPSPTAESTPTPNPGPTVSPAATSTPEPTTAPTPSPAAVASPTPTPQPTPEPPAPATPARTPTVAATATPTPVPTAASATAPAPSPTAAPTPIPTIPVVPPTSESRVPAWVIAVAGLVILLLLVGGIGILLTPRNR